MNNVGEFYKLDEKRRKRFQEGMCLHPQAPEFCSRGFIAAHTVQRAMIEKYIAEQQHVLKFKADSNPSLGAVLFSPALVGQRKATTFNGFCGFHDNELFKPLEAKRFTFSERQIALLGFRAFSRELYAKMAQLDVFRFLKDRMLADESLMTLERLDWLASSTFATANACENLRRPWNLFGNMLNEGAFSELRYFGLEFDHAPQYFSSMAFLPEWDFDGNEIQDLSAIESFNGISFSAWAANDHSTAIFCWHQSWDGVCMPFIESLLRIDPSRLSNRILSMAFEVSENIIMKPSWWNGMLPRDRDMLAARVPSGLNSCDRTATCLCDDGLTALPSGAVTISSKL